jgi:hypothetical protein
MNNPNINNYSNPLPQLIKNLQINREFLAIAFSSFFAAFKRLTKPAMLVLVGYLILPLAIVVTPTLLQ